MLRTPNLSLDPIWVDTWLKCNEIFTFEIVKIKISDLKIFKFINGKWEILPILNSPALAYLEGNKKAYIDYITYKNSHVPGDVHTIDRFDNLIRSYKYNGEISIAINPSNVILDGQHRACLLFSKNKDLYVNVIKLYGNY